MANLSCQPDEIYSYQRTGPLGNPIGIILIRLVKVGRHIPSGWHHSLGWEPRVDEKEEMN